MSDEWERARQRLQDANNAKREHLYYQMLENRQWFFNTFLSGSVRHPRVTLFLGFFGTLILFPLIASLFFHTWLLGLVELIFILGLLGWAGLFVGSFIPGFSRTIMCRTSQQMFRISYKLVFGRIPSQSPLLAWEDYAPRKCQVSRATGSQNSADISTVLTD